MITKQITAIRICMFCRPMPLIHGVSVKSTITEKTFRENTIPTNALPMSYNWEGCQRRSNFFFGHDS